MDTLWENLWATLLCLTLTVTIKAGRWENHDPWKIGEFELSATIKVDTETSDITDSDIEKALIRPSRDAKLLMVDAIRDLARMEFHLNDGLNEIIRMTMKDLRTFKNIKNSLSMIVYESLNMREPRLEWYYDHKDCTHDDTGVYCTTQVDVSFKFFNAFKLKGHKQMKKEIYKDSFLYRIKSNLAPKKAVTHRPKTKPVRINMKHIYNDESIQRSLENYIWTLFFGKGEDADNSLMIIIPSSDSTIRHNTKMAHSWENLDPWKITEFEVTARFEIDTERSDLNGHEMEITLKQPGHKAKLRLVEDIRNLTNLEFQLNDEVTKITKMMMKGFKTFKSIKNSLKILVHESLENVQPRLAWFYDNTECILDDTGHYCMTRAEIKLKLVISNKIKELKEKVITFEDSFLYRIGPVPPEALTDKSDTIRKPLIVKMKHSYQNDSLANIFTYYTQKLFFMSKSQNEDTVKVYFDRIPEADVTKVQDRDEVYLKTVNSACKLLTILIILAECWVVFIIGKKYYYVHWTLSVPLVVIWFRPIAIHYILSLSILLFIFRKN